MLARFCYLLGLVAAFVAGVLIPCPQAAERERDYVAAPIVHEHESPDPQNRFFDLVFRNDSDDDGNAGVTHIGIVTPKASKLANWLASHDGERVAWVFRAGGTLNRDGD